VNRKRIGYFVRAALSAVVLAVLVTSVDWTDVAALGTDGVDVTWLGVALILLAAAVSVRVVSFWLLANHRGRVMGFGQAAYLTLVGSAAGLVLPGGTGDLFKAHVASRSSGNHEHMTVSSVVDKLTSLSAVSGMGVAGALAIDMPLLAAVSGAIFILSTLLVFAPKLLPWRLVVRVIAPSRSVRREELAASLAASRGLLFGVLGVSVLGWLVTYSMVFALCRAFAAPVSLTYVLAIGPIVTLSTLLPLSVAGIGLSQLTLVTLLVQGGVAEGIAGRVALGQLALLLLPPLVGLVLYAGLGTREWSAEVASPIAEKA